MTLPHTPYAATTNPQMSYLDDTFAAVGALGIVPCTATGTNAYTLTPATNAPTISAYANYQRFSFIVPNTSTGDVTLQVGALAALNAYQSDGTTRLSTGDLVANRYIDVTYNAALNAAAGGFSLNTPTTQVFGAATKAQTIAATNGSVFVSPVQVINSPFAVKAWGHFSSTGVTISASSGASCTKNSTGNYTMTLGVTMASATFVANITAIRGAGTFAETKVVSLTNTTVTYETADGAAAITDLAHMVQIVGNIA